MSRAKKHWSDTNRFNQTICMEAYREDYRKAERRAYCHDRLIKLKTKNT